MAATTATAAATLRQLLLVILLQPLLAHQLTARTSRVQAFQPPVFAQHSLLTQLVFRVQVAAQNWGRAWIRRFQGIPAFALAPML